MSETREYDFDKLDEHFLMLFGCRTSSRRAVEYDEVPTERIYFVLSGKVTVLSPKREDRAGGNGLLSYWRRRRPFNH